MAITNHRYEIRAILIDRIDTGADSAMAAYKPGELKEELERVLGGDLCLVIEEMVVTKLEKEKE